MNLFRFCRLILLDLCQIRNALCADMNTAVSLCLYYQLHEWKAAFVKCSFH